MSKDKIIEIYQKTKVLFLAVGSGVTLTASELVLAQDKNKLTNPVSSASNITELVTKLLQVVAQFGAIVCIFFIIYSGFLYVTANGDETKIKTAHKTFLWSVVGTAVLLGAWVIAELIKNTVSEVTGL